MFDDDGDAVFVGLAGVAELPRVNCRFRYIFVTVRGDTERQQAPLERETGTPPPSAEMLRQQATLEREAGTPRALVCACLLPSRTPPPG